MVKYTIATLQAMVGVKPTISIDKIHECPEFSTLWNIKSQLVDIIRKVLTIKCPLDGHAGYI